MGEVIRGSEKGVKARHSRDAPPTCSGLIPHVPEDTPRKRCWNLPPPQTVQVGVRQAFRHRDSPGMDTR